MLPTLSTHLRDKLRVGPWLVAALIMAAIVGLLYPHQLGVLLWSLTKLSFGAYLGYWIDRSIFPYARPGDALDPPPPDARDYYLPLMVEEGMMDPAMLMLRRAIIIAAAIIALGLGV
ncbi:putative holin [Halomonas sp. SSL-5]|uniref:putative holin n=1 Tax=Halomonas sp. SSL-5 TaxID=3065855 RepID=UPI00273852DE|nr:putative holin [Halomonas sp. SSL-5]MDY7117147.1 putative holin [Halomonas sp. SSL-5]